MYGVTHDRIMTRVEAVGIVVNIVGGSGGSDIFNFVWHILVPVISLLICRKSSAYFPFTS